MTTTETLIQLNVQSDGLQSFACARASRFHLQLTVNLQAGDTVEESDIVEVTFRDLFSDDTDRALPVWRQPVGRRVRANEQVSFIFDVDSQALQLDPSCYHLRADLLRGAKSLAGRKVGSGTAYFMADGESAEHAMTCYGLALSVFSWNGRDGAYMNGLGAPPATCSPFDGAWDEYLAAFNRPTHMVGELLHDGAMAFLHLARLFRAAGEVQRAAFCERSLRRVMDEVVFGRMLGEDGVLYDLADHTRRMEHSKQPMMEQMAAFVVKLISDSIRYFREEAGDAAYADALMERTRPIVANLQRRPFQLGCGAEQMGYISDDPAFAGKHEQTCCKVMDGRILHGICEWHSVYLDRHGIPSDWKDQWPMGRVLSFALVAAKHTMTTRGWYDDQCLGEGGCHTICGAMNILGGLLAARRLAQRYEPLGNPAIVCFFQTRRNCLLQFDAAIKVAIDFLIATQAVVTNTRFWVTPGSWGIGYLYEALAEAATLFPGHPGISDWLNTLREYSKVMDFPTKRLTGFHRLNALIPLAHACPEFNQTPAKP